MTKQQNETKEPQVILTKEQAMNTLVFLERSRLEGKETPAFNAIVEALQSQLQ